jgi:hypothetical protein
MERAWSKALRQCIVAKGHQTDRFHPLAGRRGNWRQVVTVRADGEPSPSADSAEERLQKLEASARAAKGIKAMSDTAPRRAAKVCVVSMGAVGNGPLHCIMYTNDLSMPTPQTGPIANLCMGVCFAGRGQRGATVC